VVGMLLDMLSSSLPEEISIDAELSLRALSLSFILASDGECEDIASVCMKMGVS
jgi:hypothetical protein